MKRTLLFVLALVAAGCADARQSALCEGLSVQSPLEDMRACAEQGHARAQNGLGYMYDNGLGVPVVYAEAARWYRLAAEQGYGDAQHNLGGMYELGEGVPQDYVLAYMWLNLAVAQGIEASQNRKDRVEQQMTREQIDEAQRMSREWLEAHPPGGN